MKKINTRLIVKFIGNGILIMLAALFVITNIRKTKKFKRENQCLIIEQNKVLQIFLVIMSLCMIAIAFLGDNVSFILLCFFPMIVSNTVVLVAKDKILAMGEVRDIGSLKKVKMYRQGGKYRVELYYKQGLMPMSFYVRDEDKLNQLEDILYDNLVYVER